MSQLLLLLLQAGRKKERRRELGKQILSPSLLPKVLKVEDGSWDCGREAAASPPFPSPTPPLLPFILFKRAAVLLLLLLLGSAFCLLLLLLLLQIDQEVKEKERRENWLLNLHKAGDERRKEEGGGEEARLAPLPPRREEEGAFPSLLSFFSFPLSFFFGLLSKSCWLWNKGVEPGGTKSSFGMGAEEQEEELPQLGGKGGEGKMRKGP